MIHTGDNGLQKQDKLLKRAQFVRLSRHGNSMADRFFVAAFCENQLDHPRLGITVTRRIGNAIVRNRIKRLVRESFRANRHLIRDNLDINVIAKKPAAEVSAKQAFASLEKLFCKIGGHSN